MLPDHEGRARQTLRSALVEEVESEEVSHVMRRTRDGFEPIITVEEQRARSVDRARTSLLELAREAERAAEHLAAAIAEAGQVCAQSLSMSGKILAAGNGGSAADAQHFVAELIGRMGMERAPLAAISLNVDPSVVTCIGNDYGYDNLFARQVEGLGRPGDTFVGISTSGRSANILRAFEAAKAAGMRTVAILGKTPAETALTADVVLHVQSESTPRIQEIHTAALHAICDEIETELFPGAPAPGPKQ